MNLYVWVLNLLDTKQIVNVYPFTGDVDNNGYLDTADGQKWQANATEEEIALYKKRENNPFNYGAPRQIRLGARIEL